MINFKRVFEHNGAAVATVGRAPLGTLWPHQVLEQRLVREIRDCTNGQNGGKRLALCPGCKQESAETRASPFAPCTKQESAENACVTLKKYVWGRTARQVETKALLDSARHTDVPQSLGLPWSGNGRKRRMARREVYYRDYREEKM